MLKLIRNIRELDFYKLTEIYRESIYLHGIMLEYNGVDDEDRWAAEQEFYRYLTDVFFLDPYACYAVLDTGDCYLAALRLEKYRDGLLITGLETKPEVRGQGYATELLRNVMRMMREAENDRLYSHIHKNNAVSLHVHLKNGFSIIADGAMLLDGSYSTEYYTLCCDQNKNKPG